MRIKGTDCPHSLSQPERCRIEHEEYRSAVAEASAVVKTMADKMARQDGEKRDGKFLPQKSTKITKEKTEAGFFNREIHEIREKGREIFNRGCLGLGLDKKFFP